MSEQTTMDLACRACGAPLAPEDLACPACGQLVHVPELNALASEAVQRERAEPAEAARLWRRALSLVPPESPQAQMLQERIQSLGGNHQAAGGIRGFLSPGGSGAAAILKTFVSMLISFAVYSLALGYSGDVRPADAAMFGAGFVLLILVHEMGHVVALRYYGVPASPPIFIPFVGAVINIAPPKNALEESVVGIGGPVLGTIGALVCFGIFRLSHSPILLQVAYWGFAINLFNLLPVPPLDGGRIVAAVTPWFWIPGLIAMGILLVHQLLSPVVLIVLMFGLPRIWQTFRYRKRMGAYYNVGRKATITMGASYLVLGLLLAGMMYYSYGLLGPNAL